MQENRLFAKSVEYAKSIPDIDIDVFQTAILSFENLEALYHIVNCHFETLGIYKSQFLAMYVLFFTFGQTLTSAELADQLHMSRSGMTRCLDSLEKKSYIMRMRSGNDGRNRTIQITETGRACLTNDLNRHITFISKTFSCLSPEERKTMILIVSKLKEFTNAMIQKG